MSNEVEIVLDKSRLLRLNFKAVSKYEKSTGDNLLNTILTGDYSFTKVSNIIWAGLVWNDDELTQEDVADLIQDEWLDKQEKTFIDLVSLISKALLESGLIGKKKKKKATVKKESSTET